MKSEKEVKTIFAELTGEIDFNKQMRQFELSRDLTIGFRHLMLSCKDSRQKVDIFNNLCFFSMQSAQVAILLKILNLEDKVRRLKIDEMEKESVSDTCLYCQKACALLNEVEK